MKTYKEYYKENKERIKKHNRDYMRKIYYPLNKEKIKEKNKKHYDKNSNEEYKKRQNKEARERYKLNPQKRINQVKDYQKKKRLTDKEFVIKLRIKQRITLVFSENNIPKKYKRCINIATIINHLKPIPQDLENYDLHHIIPISKFTFVIEGKVKPKAIRTAFSPENHQLLLRKEHKNHHKIKMEIDIK